MPTKTKSARRPRATRSASSRTAGIGQLEAIAEHLLRLSDADETEVEIEAGSDALTRFANNTIHQNVAEQTLDISVRAVIDGRTARATTNKTDEDSLRRVLATAISLARNEPEYPGLLPTLGPQKYQRVARSIPATAAVTPQDRAGAVAGVCKMAEKNKQTAAGIFSTGSSHSIFANSRGLSAHYDETGAEFSVTILEQDSSGWAKANSPDITNIDPDDLAARASRKCSQSRAPKPIEPGHYTVILEPPAVLDLVGFLFYDFAGTAVLDKRSCLNDRMGKKILGDNITLWDDVYHPLQTGQPYDGEGVPRQKVLLVDRGVPKNLVFAGGEPSVDKMVRTTERGILVTRLWYIREVDPYEKILTGMTRDGTF